VVLLLQGSQELLKHLQALCTVPISPNQGIQGTLHLDFQVQAPVWLKRLQSEARPL
jgi:hypothetical protein